MGSMTYRVGNGQTRDVGWGPAASQDIRQQISGQEVAGFCHPHGGVERRVIQGLEDAGYD